VSETSERKAKEIIKEIWESLHWVPLPGLPEGKIEPATAREDEGPYLSTSHKKKTEEGRERRPSSQHTATAGIFGIAAIQKEYLGEDGGSHVLLEGQNVPYISRGGPRQREEKSAEREHARRLAEKIILTFPRKESGIDRRRGKVSLSSYCFDSADIDLDRTLERVIGKEVIDYQDFVVYERSQEKRAYALIVDVSGSMRGESIVRALVALSAFVKSTAHSDYAIITFCDRMNVLKQMRQRKSLASLTAEVFQVATDGLTDLATGLREGLLQLAKSPCRKKIGIILTDGAHNKHSDPFVLAQQYPQLHVVGIRPPWPEARRTCEKLARLGRGRCVVLNEIEEIPKAMHALLCNDFFVGTRVGQLSVKGGSSNGRAV
jgi:Mg-chelatase subunit ChlD